MLALTALGGGTPGGPPMGYDEGWTCCGIGEGAACASVALVVVVDVPFVCGCGACTCTSASICCVYACPTKS